MGLQVGNLEEAVFDGAAQQEDGSAFVLPVARVVDVGLDAVRI